MNFWKIIEMITRPHWAHVEVEEDESEETS